MQSYRMPPLPEVVKNLLILNILMYIIAMLFPAMQEYFAMYAITSSSFQPYQIITHMFMHSQQSFMHIFFNMFALYMFGRDAEYSMGAKRFLVFYFITGLGAAFLHQVTGYIEYQYALQQVTAEQLDIVTTQGLEAIIAGQNFTDPDMAYLNSTMNSRVVGASGAVYGVLVAFGMLFPNRMIMLLIPPIPMKAKYFVLIMGVIELYLSFSNSSDGVAHFAHLGGALFGFLLILFWRKRGQRF